MRVLLKKDFTIELKSVGKVINVNDSMVSRLEVEVEENFLLPGERLWVVFSKTKDNPTDDITKEIQLGTDNKTYSVAIPQGVVMQEGTWYFILSARKYYSEEKYFTRRATEPYEFTVKGGLWIDENTSEVVNNGTAQSLYEMVVDKLANEQENAKDIVALQEDVSKAKTDILAERTDREASVAEIRHDVNYAMDQVENLNSGLSIAFSRIDSFRLYDILPSLPASGDTNKLYLVPSSKQEEDNILEEWLWVNGAWEMVGTKKVEIDLTPYAKKDEVISLSQKGAANGVATLDANGKVPKTQLPDDIGSGGGVSEDRVQELIDEKVGDIETALDSVITLQNSLIGGNV